MIIRHNENLRSQVKKGAPGHLIAEFAQVLQFHIATYFNNELPGQPRVGLLTCTCISCRHIHNYILLIFTYCWGIFFVDQARQRSGGPIKSICCRLKAKEGRIGVTWWGSVWISQPRHLHLENRPHYFYCKACGESIYSESPGKMLEAWAWTNYDGDIWEKSESGAKLEFLLLLFCFGSLSLYY